LHWKNDYEVAENRVFFLFNFNKLMHCFISENVSESALQTNAIIQDVVALRLLTLMVYVNKTNAERLTVCVEFNVQVYVWHS
jgi:hypothetical protein